MSRLAVELGELRPNPFKRFILGGRLDEAKILRLVESIEQTGFWENVVCRKGESQYELGYGHKRVEAAIRKLGKKHKIEIPCLALSDEQMIQMMAAENATGEEESVEAQIDVVALVGKHLKEKFEHDGKLFEPGTREFVLVPGTKTKEGRADNALKPDAGERISAFLGVKNWSRKKVSNLLQLREKLHKSVLHELKNDSSLGVKAGMELVKLEKPTQKAVFDLATEGGHRPTVEDFRRITETAKDAPKEKRHDVATREAVKVADEVRVRKFKSSKKDGQRRIEDITSHIARVLPAMRKVIKLYEEIGGAIDSIGENFLADKAYQHSGVLGEFHVLGDSIVELHSKIFSNKRGLLTS